MDAMREIELRVLCEVIEAVEGLLVKFEATGGVVAVTRPQAYALVIQAVMASARATGHHGAGSLARAPLLDAILSGAEETPWEAAVFRVLVGSLALH
ncbi:hypothetical protein JK358_04625 [Nocardia sp. 2]|uniref:Uncharacterized protein n=1 Tax=Nocardia acididurans TaxID=2802282 RepID=A0ABS1LZL2_9NOCA|nr:hypothetical protein [Nocardia acididurans]MBL1073670.1 hypothetical protein [Nocardia acididurans]